MTNLLIYLMYVSVSFGGTDPFAVSGLDIDVRVLKYCSCVKRKENEKTRKENERKEKTS